VRSRQYSSTPWSGAHLFQKKGARKKMPGHSVGMTTLLNCMKKLKRIDFDEDGVALAFAALGEPSGETFRETGRSEAEAGFDAAIGDGERVVKVGGVGEVAHAELVEPIERAGFSVALNHDVHGKLLRVHASILAGRKEWK
jgi:hypothetical protein